VFRMKSVMIGTKKTRFDQYAGHCIVSNFRLHLDSHSQILTATETSSAPTLARSNLIRLSSRAPCVTRHLTDVSDSHSVVSHSLSPSRAPPVYATSLMIAPCIVIDADAVPTWFCRRITLHDPKSNVHAFVTLPSHSPAIIITCCVPRSPCATRQLPNVSDSHLIASHPVCPSHERPVYVISPMLAPNIVTHVDAVHARIYRCITLNMSKSTVHACDTLPSRSLPAPLPSYPLAVSPKLQASPNNSLMCPTHISSSRISCASPKPDPCTPQAP